MAGVNQEMLSGGEIRFLRHELGLSQATLSLLLGVTERTIIHWENDRSNREIGNPAAERTLRLLCIDKVLGKPGVSEALELIAHLEDRFNRLGEFSYCEDNEWHENIAA